MIATVKVMTCNSDGKNNTDNEDGGDDDDD